MSDKRINYRAFIQDNFQIINKAGEVVPFVFNETQNYYYDLLLAEFPSLQGVRENILKFRQPGFSSLIDAIFTVDFIFSELGKAPIIDADIVSHKEKETKVLFNRVDFFLESFFTKQNVHRKAFLESDNSLILKGRRGASINVQTANAKVSGRGGTKQNIHWSEVAFYPSSEILNAEDLVIGAEQQVADGIGKIFRETTGNMSGDFFDLEFDRGERGIGEFKSRFLGWWLHKEYTREAPSDFIVPEYYTPVVKKFNIDRNQIYWHYRKIQSARDPKKAKREYPTYKNEAFILNGEGYFDQKALLDYEDMIKEPIKKGGNYVQIV